MSPRSSSSGRGWPPPAADLGPVGSEAEPRFQDEVHRASVEAYLGLSRVLAQAQYDQGVSHRELAESAGVSTSTLHGLLTGKSWPRLSSFQGVAQALGFSLELEGDADVRRALRKRVRLDLKESGGVVAYRAGVMDRTLYDLEKRDPRMSTLLGLVHAVRSQVELRPLPEPEVEAGEEGWADSWEAVFVWLLEAYPSEQRMRLKSSHRRVAHLAHGWFMRVRASCQSVMLLRVSGLGAEAWPMRRAALEHVLALRWLSERGDLARDVVVRTHGESARKRRDAAEDAGWNSAEWPVWAQVKADADNAVENMSESHMLANVKERCATYGLPGDYASWLVETNHSHPGWETASPYVQREPLKLLSSAQWDGSLGDAEFCARRLFRALVSMNDMMEDGPFAEVISEGAARMTLLSDAGGGADGDGLSPWT